MEFCEEIQAKNSNEKTFTLTEYPNKELLKNIFRHPDIYNDDRKRIRKYCINAKDGFINIKYSKKGKYGRYYPVDGSIICCTYMWRKLRATLFADTEFDVDIKSCHFQILINEVNPEFNLNFLQELINNRNEMFKLFYINNDAIKLYNHENQTDLTKKDIIKKLLTRILNGGLIENWYIQFNLKDNDVKFPKWFNDVKEDITKGIKFLLYKYKDLFKDIKLHLLKEEQKKWENDQQEFCSKDKRKKSKKFNANNHCKSIGRSNLLALFFQEKESNIIDNTYDFIKKEFNIKPTAYCYDGLQFLKKDIKNPDLFIKKVNKNSNVIFVYKDFSEKLVTQPEYCDSFYFDVNEFKMLPQGLEQEKYFNKFYFRIHSLNGMCYVDADGMLKNIKNDTSHFAKIINFWNKYKWSGNVKEYFTYGNFPNKDLLPDKIYNTWTGFEIEKYNFDTDADISVILYHFEVVANFNTNVYNYLLNYFAWLMQRPHKKTNVCLLIQGLQGTGKTTLVENLLKSIMGRKYVFDTCDIDKIVGKFNSSVAGKLMCVLNEATGKDTNGVIDKIKDSITRTDIAIEHKGQDPIMTIDYCNFCFTTNHIKPICINKDDRRFQVTECSDKYKGNIEYFNKLYSNIEDKQVMKSFYKYLMNKNISKFNPERDRVLTEATIDLHELNKEPVCMFLEYLYSDEFYKNKRRYKMSIIYKEFKTYMISIGYKHVCNLPTFSKIIKKYIDKYNYKITHSKGISYITFEDNWIVIVECKIHDDIVECENHGDECIIDDD